jgi:hypothetical protein
MSMARHQELSEQSRLGMLPAGHSHGRGPPKTTADEWAGSNGLERPAEPAWSGRQERLGVGPTGGVGRNG